MKRGIITGLMVWAILILCGAWLLAQRPPRLLEPQEPRPRAISSQEAIDAVQNTEIAELTRTVMIHSEQIVSLLADRNWLMGGLTVIGGLAVVVQTLSLVHIRKSK